MDGGRGSANASGDAIAHIRAQFVADCGLFKQEVLRFCGGTTPGFHTEHNEIRRKVREFEHLLDDRTKPRERTQERFAKLLSDSMAAIRAIPTATSGVLLPSESPLQTYFRLRAECASAISRLDVFDPYLDANVFPIPEEFAHAALERNNGNRTLTAEQLEIGPATLFRKLKRYGDGPCPPCQDS